MTEFEPKKILIVEDNEINQKVMALLVKQLGHIPLQVFDGYKAITVAKDEKPDLILLDIQMEGMTGIEVAKILRKDLELRKIPIIIVTAFASSVDKINILTECGCEDFMAKPFTPKEFCGRIAHYLPVKKVDWE